MSEFVAIFLLYHYDVEWYWWSAFFVWFILDVYSNGSKWEKLDKAIDRFNKYCDDKKYEEKEKTRIILNDYQ
jgi:hypothetical protein